MDLRLQNSWEQTDAGRWDWTAYLTGADLSHVQRVEYFLHPTFRDPHRVVEDAAGGFPLKTSAWGPFRLKAIVHLDDGRTETLTHDLKLEHSPPNGRTDEG
ncbi:MAG: hypothetical protein HYR84_01840 [Planctomycetes bacterium]|nr:hypothetical protein [Planctomycetota bacterium]